MKSRKIEENSNGNKALIIKIIVAIILLIIVAIVVIKVIAKTENENVDTAQVVIDNDNVKENSDNDVTIIEMDAQKTLTGIDKIVSDFGGQIESQVNNDTYYITKDGVSYTAYLDGDIIEGKIEIWDGSSKEPQVDEAGNANIYTASELKWVADQVISGEKNFNGVTISLRNNIDLGARVNEDGSWTGNNWTAIVGFLDGSTEEENLKRFAGTFDGNNFTIRGLYINSEANYQGLFGFSAGTIANLTLKNSYIKTTKDVVGAIVGLNEGVISNCQISRVYVEGNNKIGGIVGVNLPNSSIENCNVLDSESITKGINYVGGIVGYMNNNSKVSYTNNRVLVEGQDYVGGISGIAFSGSQILGSSNNSTKISGNDYIGGIVGYNQGELENNYNNCNEFLGEISGHDFVGGISGINYDGGNISSCCNYGSINSTFDNIGGICGANNSIITDTFNNGKISISGKEIGIKVGGICGQNLSNGSIFNSYNIGKVTTTVQAGGVVGANFGTVTNAFYIGSVVTGNVSDNDNARTTDEVKNSVETLGANFKQDVDNKNNGFPVLLWQ